MESKKVCLAVDFIAFVEGRVKILTQILNTKELVNIFGTKIEIKKYNSNKLHHNYINKKILNKAKTKCDISFVGDGKYEILNYYEKTKPLFFIENSENIYYYIAYNILKQLQNKYNSETTPLIMGKMGWNKKIDMINDNYYKVKFNKDKVSEMFNVNVNNIYDFYSVVSKSLNYYVKNTLELLKKQKLLEYEYDILMICTHKNYSENKYDNLIVENHRQATDEERRKIIDIKYRLMKEFGINDDNIYYSKKSTEFKAKLEKELEDIGVFNHYKGYKIFYTTKNRVNNFLEWYKEDDIDIVKIMNSLFISITNKNASSRNKNKDYIENYSKLSDLILKAVDYEILNLDTRRFNVEVAYGSSCISTKINVVK